MAQAEKELLEKIAASTGPRSRERGWLVVEGVKSEREIASTGPRSRERGWLIHGWSWGGHGKASTGPRSRERGWGIGRMVRMGRI